MKYLLTGYEVLFQSNENILEVGKRGGCRTLSVY